MKKTKEELKSKQKEYKKRWDDKNSDLIKCPLCRKWKPENGVKSICKDCEKGESAPMKRKIRRQKLIAEYKDKPCARCGVKYPHYVMDFHHRDPSTKRFEIGQMATGKKPWETVLEEIEKCDLLCSNCHRIVSYEEKCFNLP